ncbi:copper homeostasis protein CutC [Sphingobacterium sp. HJSM2_6]|uniref:copper homeostasis protein CutC n=1 Tax=Sphingobacterium sp. HJSM2_6 TaxID=3366264 RepID=UPI003BE8D13C
MSEKVINGYKLEICANSLYSAKEAEKGGASRVELCQNLENGGTTPSYGLIKLTRQHLSIGIHVLIRPRGGDFLYSNEEFEEMMEDVRFCKEIGCDGVVIGVLDKDGNIDEPRMSKLIEIARPLTVVFHRAFDLCPNPLKSLDTLIALGCDRVLTSGQEHDAFKGKEKLKEWITKAAGQIEVMPGSGVNAENITAILSYTGASAIHSSAKVIIPSGISNPEQEDFGMGGELMYSSSERVEEMVNKIKSL